MANQENLQKLAEKFFADELGLTLKEIPEAANNLNGFFEVLLRIDERLNKEKGMKV